MADQYRSSTPISERHKRSGTITRDIEDGDPRIFVFRAYSEYEGKAEERKRELTLIRKEKETQTCRNVAVRRRMDADIPPAVEKSKVGRREI
jgi:hypothetical protein